MRKIQVLDSLEKVNAVRPKVKEKLRHETLKPEPLTEKMVTSKHLWQFQVVCSGALSPCNSEHPPEVQTLPLRGQPENVTVLVCTQQTMSGTPVPAKQYRGMNSKL